tara:strand:+ start:411 stop:689 length:279 start_codon:yes stop_codon:yes gene_type:complete
MKTLFASRFHNTHHEIDVDLLRIRVTTKRQHHGVDNHQEQISLSDFFIHISVPVHGLKPTTGTDIGLYGCVVLTHHMVQTTSRVLADCRADK